MGNNGGECIFWDENADDYGGFFTDQDFQNNQIFQSSATNQSLYAVVNGVNGVNVVNGVNGVNVVNGVNGVNESITNQQIRLSPESNPINHQHPEGEDEENTSQSRTPLGLKLRTTPSFLNLVQSSLSKGKQHAAESSDNANHDNLRLRRRNDETRSTEKLKASNFPAYFIKIGSWQRLTMHEGDLTAKLYYAKKKLVWEVLEGALKSKIEVQWSDISAIQAITIDNEPGILQIELSQPPLFYREINPQPRKHTLWQQASDFTGGQAPIYRRHFVRFPPGILDKHYEKLLLCDQRLCALSKQSFPSHESPYFDPTIYGISQLSHIFNTIGPNNNVLYPSYNAYPPQPAPPPAPPSFPRRIPSSTIVPAAMDYPYTINGGGNMNINQFAAPAPAPAPPAPAPAPLPLPPMSWGEGSSHGYQVEHQQNYQEPNVGVGQYPTSWGTSEAGSHGFQQNNYHQNPNSGQLNDIEQHLLGDSQVLPFNESHVPMETMNSWMGPAMDFNQSYNVGNSSINIATAQDPVMMQTAAPNANYNYDFNYNNNYNYNVNNNNSNVVVPDQQALYSQNVNVNWEMPAAAAAAAGEQALYTQNHGNWQMPAVDLDDSFFMEQQMNTNSLPAPAPVPAAPYYFHGNNPNNGGFY